MKKPLLTVSMAILLALGASNGYADEVSDQIESGLKAYAEKDFKLALEELKFAEAQLQELVNNENQTLLPEAPEGWKAKEAKTSSQMMMLGAGGTVMSREYTRGKEKMKVEVAANSPLMGVMTMMMKNPMMMASNPKMKPYRYKRQKGMIELKNGKMETKLMLAGQVLVSLTLKGKDDDLKDNGKKTTESFLEKMDFAKIKASLLE